MKVRVKKSTIEILRRLSMFGLLIHNGSEFIEVSKEVAEELVRRGADLSDPESVERVIIEATKGNGGNGGEKATA